MKNFASNLFSSIGQAFTPQLTEVQAQAQSAANQLTLAFEVLIGEGAVIILLLLVLIWKTK